MSREAPRRWKMSFSSARGIFMAVEASTAWAGLFFSKRRSTTSAFFAPLSSTTPLERQRPCLSPRVDLSA